MATLRSGLDCPLVGMLTHIITDLPQEPVLNYSLAAAFVMLALSAAVRFQKLKPAVESRDLARAELSRIRTYQAAKGAS